MTKNRKFLIGTAVSAAAIAVLPSAAFAGEVTGTGKPTNMEGHANSACGFSGLEDAANGGPGVVQNWGHVKQAFGLSGGANNVVAFGEGCNANLFPQK